MRVRFGKQQLAAMRTASRNHHLSYSEIARKALRRFRRQGEISPEQQEVESTYGGEAIRIDVKETEFPGVTGVEVRRAVALYLSEQPLSAAPSVVNDGGLVAGVDYFI